MDIKHTGSCLCGAVEFQATPLDSSAYYCHCRDCQKGSASAFTVAIFCPTAQFALTRGSLTTYTKHADSGRRVERNFCAHCGTALTWSGEGFPGFVLLSLSSLDDPEAFTPVHVDWRDRELSWCHISDDIESFPGRPDRDFCA